MIHRQPNLSALFTRALISAITLTVGPEARAQDFKDLRQLMEKGQLNEALATIESQRAKTSDPEMQRVLDFAQAHALVRSRKPEDAKTALESSLSNSHPLEDYARFALGEAHVTFGQNKEAAVQFRRVADTSPNTELQLLARIHLSEALLNDQKWNEASKHLSWLERRTRSRTIYPRVLSGLMMVDFMLKKRSQMCRWARKLYAKFPDAPQVAHWDLDLQNAKINEAKIGCVASLEDQRQRIRNLQFAGDSQEAQREIGLLQSRVQGLTSFTADRVLVNFLIEDGEVPEALKLLEKYSESHKFDFQYLTLFGKAAVRSGDFETAAATYEKIARITGMGRKGLSAFQMAAHLSFLSKDYDTAKARYQTLKSRYGGRSVGRDAAWFLAFIDYMRGDYVSALNAFKSLRTTPPPRRRGRRSSPQQVVSQDRIRYWVGMTLLKLGRIEDSKEVFRNLSQDKGFGYYSLLAQSRFQQISKMKIPTATKSMTLTEVTFKSQVIQGVPAPLDLVRMGSHAPLPLLVSGETQPDLPAPEPAPEGGAEAESVTGEEEKSSEEAAEIAVIEDLPENASDAGDSEAPQETPAESSEDAPIEVGSELLTSPILSQTQDPRILKRFQRANLLTQLGLSEWARHELLEVERRTMNREYLKRLLVDYEASENFFRSSVVAELGFRAARIGGGLSGARSLWEHAYPQAYKGYVLEAAKAGQVPPEFAWAIMRAESQYRPDVKSGVGALGLMQVMPMTGIEVAKRIPIPSFKVHNLLAPQTNIRVGAKYLGKLLNQFEGRVPLAAAAYNAGPHRVEAWIKYLGRLDMDEFVEHIPYGQTRNYVKKVSHNFTLYQALYGSGPSNSAVTAPAWMTAKIGITLDRPVSPKEIWPD